MSKGQRHWHPVHADGRPWTDKEMDGVVRRMRERSNMFVDGVYADDYCIDGFGVIYIVDSDGMAWSHGGNGYRDMDAEWEE